MQGLQAVAGVRSLEGIIAAASSARVLDLLSLTPRQRNGLMLDDPQLPAPPATEGGADAEAAGEFKPMFVHPLLNRCIIVKHNVAPGEEERLAPRRFNSTKVIFPFDPDDLSLGGQYLFVEQHDFIGALARHLEYGDLSISRDVEVLRLLDKLPTLDPFLVRESLARRDIAVDKCYFRVSDPDKVQMLSFVESEIGSLIRLCFGDLGVGERGAKRLSRLLLADEDSPDLAPLQLTLQMNDEEFSEAMFAWKAFLYYRWRTETLAPALKMTLRSLSRISKRRYDTDGLRFVVSAKKLLEREIFKSWREIGERLRLYDQAYEALIQDQKPQNFRRFLTNGSSLFIDLGERVGRLEQVVSFWAYRLDQHHAGTMSVDEVMDAMRDLLQGLSIWPSEEMPAIDDEIPPLRPHAA